MNLSHKQELKIDKAITKLSDLHTPLTISETHRYNFLNRKPVTISAQFYIADKPSFLTFISKNNAKFAITKYIQQDDEQFRKELIKHIKKSGDWLNHPTEIGLKLIPNSINSKIG